jgi:hypothetical protein
MEMQRERNKRNGRRPFLKAAKAASFSATLNTALWPTLPIRTASYHSHVLTNSGMGSMHNPTGKPVLTSTNVCAWAQMLRIHYESTPFFSFIRQVFRGSVLNSDSLWLEPLALACMSNLLGYIGDHDNSVHRIMQACNHSATQVCRQNL